MASLWAERLDSLVVFYDKFSTLQSPIKLFLEHCSSSIKVQKTLVSIKMVINKPTLHKNFLASTPTYTNPADIQITSIKI